MAPSLIRQLYQTITAAPFAVQHNLKITVSNALQTNRCSFKHSRVLMHSNLQSIWHMLVSRFITFCAHFTNTCSVYKKTNEFEFKFLILIPILPVFPKVAKKENYTFLLCISSSAFHSLL